MHPLKTTPMIKQYLSIKAKYPDIILFYRMGDFYEMFFDDAKFASKILEITLTSRNKKDEFPVPMCGVPFRAAQTYISRLIKNGCKVAICDQVEDPRTAKGIVKREVVRVITPGMIVDNEFLDEKSNNYVLSLSKNSDSTGISYLDLSTGAFRLSESEDLLSIIDEIRRVSPSEIVLPESSKNDQFFSSIIKSLPEKSITFLSDNVFEYKKGYKKLIDQFKTISLKGFGCEDLKAGIRAAGALIFYVQETQKQKIEHIRSVETYSLNNYLIIDDLTCRNLELTSDIISKTRKGSLLGIVDRTVTSMGARQLKTWIRYPLVDEIKINLRLDAVEDVKNNIRIRRNIREILKSIYDLERLGSKVSMGYSNARDLYAIKRSINSIPDILSNLSHLKAEFFKWDENFDDLYELADLIKRAIRDDALPTINEGGIIRPEFNKELSELVEVRSQGKSWLAKLEAKEKKLTGITFLKVRYNKIFGYYIEIPKTRLKDIPGRYIRKQTLVNAERFITDELKTYEDNIISANERVAALEYQIFNDVRQEVIKNNPAIQKAARFLADLDCLCAFAEVADQNNYNRPEITRDGAIMIDEGRHPVVEKMITGERFVPNNIKIDNNESQILIITGPNMAGKSTFLRQVALLVLMAQMGCFVPAKKASISIVDRIFTRVGALDNLSQGQSTFMVEMQETANILNNATEHSLVIMDEIGRGTSTFDGFSIAWAVAEYLHDLKDRGVKTLFATHYHELTDLVKTKNRVKNYNIEVGEWNDEIIFLRKLVKGATNRSYGIQVARLAGVPEKVVSRSKKILFNIENKERRLNGSCIFQKTDNSLKERQEQLNLFRGPESFVIEKLKKLDTLKITPLEALNYLNKLQKELHDSD